MKRLYALLLVAALLCGVPALAEEQPEDLPSVAELITEASVVAMVGTYMTEEELLAYYEEIRLEASLKAELIEDVVFTQSLNEAVLMLRGGRARYVFTIMDTANYVARRNEGLQAARSSLVCSLHMVAMKDNKMLIYQINDALDAIRKAGKIEMLYGQWVQTYVQEAEPKPVDMPVIDGADTIRVGVSGDIPPIDYVAADGTPAGFNVAILAELSKELGMNIELVSIDGGARFTALASGRIDAFFWHQTVQGAPKVDGADALAISEAYLSLPFGIVLEQL